MADIKRNSLSVRNNFLKVLTVSTIVALSSSKVVVEDDTDLTGCSVQMDSYIFNLAGL